MGQEISNSRFNAADFAVFKNRLTEETALLERWFHEGRFTQSTNRGGFELEAWLINDRAEPAAVNESYLNRLDNPLVVPELARFNVEINGTPQTLAGNALSRMADELKATWLACNRTAQEFAIRLAMIGILPSAGREHLTLASMSDMARYRALNEQVLRLRGGRPIDLQIDGRETLRSQHDDVMLESAATSFQIHLKVNQQEATRFYNASKILSGPMVAASANSPFLFGFDLWDETRIPLFEQSVAVGASDLTKRVSFGIRYVNESVMECFTANLHRYPVLLPQLQDEAPDQLAHLRLHNGTIWRWNRPLIGFDASGEPHLRIEHRVVPSGPTVEDSIANAALYYGASKALVDGVTPPEQQLEFAVAKTNFYAAARYGLEAEVVWLDQHPVKLRQLLIDTIIPLAHQGLESLGIDPLERDHWLGVMEQRVRSGRNGAAWQRAFVTRNGKDMRALVEAYVEQQNSGAPVHEWTV